MSEKLFTVKELAKEWKLSEKTVRDNLDKSKIEYIKVFGSVRIPESSVSKYIKSRTVKSTEKTRNK